MCGRIGKTGPGMKHLSPDELEEIYTRLNRAAKKPPFGYNIAPTQSLAFVREPRDGDDGVVVGRWGLDPVFLKTEAQALEFRRTNRYTFNARDDRLTGGMWGYAAKHSRCVVPITGFYEWQKISEKTKQPWWIYDPDEEPLLLAGLCAWHPWGESFTIVTTDANEMMAEIHNTNQRMPVLLTLESVPRWLDPEQTEIEELRDLTRPAPEDWLTAHKVKPLKGDGPGLIERLAA